MWVFKRLAPASRQQRLWAQSTPQSSGQETDSSGEAALHRVSPCPVLLPSEPGCSGGLAQNPFLRLCPRQMSAPHGYSQAVLGTGWAGLWHRPLRTVARETLRGNPGLEGTPRSRAAVGAGALQAGDS